VARRSLSNLNALAVATPPPVGIAGDIYYNTSTGSIYTSDGASWTVVGGTGGSSVSVGSSPPLGPSVGDLWYDTVLGSLFIWYDSYWVEITGGTGSGNPADTSVHPFVSKTADYLATTDDEIIAVDASGATAVIITLPTAVGMPGRQYVIKKVDGSASHVVVTTTSAQTIDGFTAQSLTVQYEALTVVSDGSNWLIV
jgi:hypothetical protein